ncbi:GTPase [Cellulomonas sp. PSBB021]|uniref:GTPase n=1 Tax=Cellulomonas sp. PSBB021 TaxID=2003551 RepID=UPI000B8D7517|nr:GTPase [Cellulomonas sp. PSBB021]ASR54158.1 GTP-binding protein HSR1 [Cellulomonas sp. PSBB021]
MSLTLEQRADALAAALDAGDGRLAPDLVEDTRALVARVRERAGLSAEHTVVALAGATGSGKSSLLNALAAADLAATGVQRPTTSHPLALVVPAGDGGQDPSALLDWLEVDRRHVLPAATTPLPPGLVLLDLPDHDSVVVEHRVRAERLVARADLLVWVVDPQKYADAALHQGFLRTLVGHDDVVVLALNQVDRLTPGDAAAVLADLRRLATADGIGAARALGLSAATGAGVDALRALVADAVRRREASTRRFGADLRNAAAVVLDACGPPVRGRTRDPRALVDALADAAGVPTVVDAVRRATVRAATARTGWPPVRWVAGLRPDPLRRLGLAPRPAPQAELARSSLPPLGAAQRARATTAVRDHADAALAGAPDAWVLAARARLDPAALTDARTGALPDALDHAIARTPLVPQRPAWWWRVVAGLQWLLLTAAVVGGLWLAGLAPMGYLRLPEPDVPQWGPVPVPTALLVGGVLAGVLVALLAGVAARLGARRRARAAGRRLRAAVAQVADALVVDPLAQETAALERCRSQAARAAAR